MVILNKDRGKTITFQLWLLYFDIVVAAIIGVFKLKGAEGQVDCLVDRHLYGPHAVHPGLIESIKIWIRRAKHAHRHGQVPTTSLCWTCRKFGNSYHFLKNKDIWQNTYEELCDQIVYRELERIFYIYEYVFKQRSWWIRTTVRKKLG